MAFCFPAATDAHLLPDAAFADAYDALTAGERAVIKTGISRMAALAGPAAGGRAVSVTAMRQGFQACAETVPAPWVIALWDGSCLSPARVLAALVPAMLAGVENILACRVAEGGGFPAPLLAALELAGQERVADVSGEEAAGIVLSCCDADPRGRLVLLDENAAFDRISDAARARNVGVRHYAAPVRIGVAVSSFAGSVPHGVLRFVHPDAVIVPVGGEAARGNVSAVFCAEHAVPEYVGAAPIILSPGNEAFWRWPGADRDFYRAESLGIRGNGPAT